MTFNYYNMSALLCIVSSSGDFMNINSPIFFSDLIAKFYKMLVCPLFQQNTSIYNKIILIILFTEEQVFYFSACLRMIVSD